MKGRKKLAVHEALRGESFEMVYRFSLYKKYVQYSGLFNIIKEL